MNAAPQLLIGLVLVTSSGLITSLPTQPSPAELGTEAFGPSRLSDEFATNLELTWQTCLGTTVLFSAVQPSTRNEL